MTDKPASNCESIIQEIERLRGVVPNDAHRQGMEKAIAALRACNPQSKSDSHADADEVLTTFLRVLGYDNVVEEYHAVADRCDGFWFE